MSNTLSNQQYNIYASGTALSATTAVSSMPSLDQFTEAVKALGLPWSDEEIKKMYDLCEKNGIDTKETLASFLATISHESRGGEAERGYDKEAKDAWDASYKEYWTKKAQGASDSELKGLKKVPWETRGGGYIQLTGLDTYNQFYKDTGIKPPPYTPPNGPDHASYVSKNYAAESAVWYWTTKNLKKFPNQSINDMIKSNNSNENTKPIYPHMAASYAVRSWPDNVASKEVSSADRNKVKSQVAAGNLNTKEGNTQRENTFTTRNEPIMTFGPPSGWYEDTDGNSGRKDDFETAAEAFGFNPYQRNGSS